MGLSVCVLHSAAGKQLCSGYQLGFCYSSSVQAQFTHKGLQILQDERPVLKLSPCQTPVPNVLTKTSEHCPQIEISMIHSLGSTDLLLNLTELREKHLNFFLIKDINIHPDAEIHKASSGRVSGTGASVSLELGCSTFLAPE